MRHSWPRRTPMKLISEGPPSYRGSASSWCSTIRSACRHHRPRQLRRATAGYREQLTVVILPLAACGNSNDNMTDTAAATVTITEKVGPPDRYTFSPTTVQLDKGKSL